MRRWKVNAVALPLNEACWLGGYGGLKPKFTGVDRMRFGLLCTANVD